MTKDSIETIADEVDMVILCYGYTFLSPAQGQVWGKAQAGLPGLERRLGEVQGETPGGWLWAVLLGKLLPCFDLGRDHSLVVANSFQNSC